MLGRAGGGGAFDPRRSIGMVKGRCMRVRMGECEERRRGGGVGTYHHSVETAAGAWRVQCKTF